jgi:hypothetical protein
VFNDDHKYLKNSSTSELKDWATFQQLECGEFTPNVDIDWPITPRVVGGACEITCKRAQVVGELPTNHGRVA